MSVANKGFSQRSAWAADQPIGYLMHKALAHPELISLAAGFVDQASLPVEATRSAATALLQSPDMARAALQYGTCAGDDLLRSQILARLRAADGTNAVEPKLEQVVLTAGSNQLLFLLAEALLDPGDIVLCDAPTYFVFMGIVKNMGARAIGIASDEGGMRMDALRVELERLEATRELHKVKAIYVMSSFDNPRAVSLAPERRPQVVEIAKAFSREHLVYVIEDAAYRELRYAGSDAPSVLSHDRACDQVVYAGTFSKSFSPGVRVGFGVLPAPLAAAVLDIKGNFDFGSPHLNQRLVSEAMRLGLYEPHVALLRDVYRGKLAIMLEALDTYLAPLGARYLRPEGGLYVWVELPASVDTAVNAPLFERSVEEGVLYVPGEYFFSHESGVPRSFMRLSFGVQSGERIARGVQGLARAIERTLG
jgi:2-aminoadipate transaminase